MTPVIVRAANSIAIDKASTSTGERSQSDVSDSFGSILLAESVFPASANGDKDGNSKHSQITEETQVKILPSSGNGPPSTADIHEVLETIFITQEGLGSKESKGAEQSDERNPKSPVLIPSEVSVQRMNDGPAAHITELALADTPASDQPILPRFTVSLLTDGTVEHPAENSIKSHLDPLSGLADRSKEILDDTVSGPWLTRDDTPAARLSLLAGFVGAMPSDNNLPEDLSLPENDSLLPSEDIKSAVPFESGINRTPLTDDDVFGDDAANIADVAEGVIFQRFEAFLLAGLMGPEHLENGDLASTTEPSVNATTVEEPDADSRPGNSFALTRGRESLAAPGTISPKDIFSSITVERNEAFASVAPPDKDPHQSAYVLGEKFNALPHAVKPPPEAVDRSEAPMPAVSAITSALAQPDMDDGNGEQAATFMATPSSDKAARTTISAADKQSSPDAVASPASDSSRAGASLFVSPQEGRLDRQSDAGPDVKPSAATNALPVQPVPTPAQQIMSGLTEQYERLVSAETGNGRIVEAEPEPLIRGGIKILRIRLQPETLGDVEVTLRRAGGEVKIGLSVGSEATAATLRQDLGTLQERLISSLLGDTTPVIEISVRDQALQSQGQYPSGTGAGSSYGLTGGSDSGSNRRPSPDRDGNSFSSEKGNEDEQVERDRRSYAGLVV
jgi:hypothetical protein